MQSYCSSKPQQQSDPAPSTAALDHLFTTRPASNKQNNSRGGGGMSKAAADKEFTVAADQDPLVTAEG